MSTHVNLADWTLRCPDGTEYAMDADGNVLLPEGRVIAKGEWFTVGPRSETTLARTPNGVMLNPERPRFTAAADFKKLRVETPVLDEVKVERIDPRTVYYEYGSDVEHLPAVDNERRFHVIGDSYTDWFGNSRVVMNPYNVLAHAGANISWNPPMRFIDPPPPHVRYRDPQTCLTRVAAAVKIALDGSVN